MFSTHFRRSQTSSDVLTSIRKRAVMANSHRRSDRILDKAAHENRLIVMHSTGYLKRGLGRWVRFSAACETCGWRGEWTRNKTAMNEERNQHVMLEWDKCVREGEIPAELAELMSPFWRGSL